MDQEVSDVLARVGVYLSPSAPTECEIPIIGIETQDNYGVLPLGKIVPIGTPDHQVIKVKVRALGELLTGSTLGFSSDRPPAKYGHLLFMLMWTAVTYCEQAQAEVRDVEFSEIYNHLRRHPDGTYANPLFSYLRATVRVYASLVDLSKSEFKSVMNHLRITARRHADGPTSTAYLAFMRAETEIELSTSEEFLFTRNSPVEPHLRAEPCEFCT